MNYNVIVSNKSTYIKYYTEIILQNFTTVWKCTNKALLHSFYIHTINVLIIMYVCLPTCTHRACLPTCTSRVCTFFVTKTNSNHQTPSICSNFGVIFDHLIEHLFQNRHHQLNTIHLNKRRAWHWGKFQVFLMLVALCIIINHNDIMIQKPNIPTSLTYHIVHMLFCTVTYVGALNIRYQVPF